MGNLSKEQIETIIVRFSERAGELMIENPDDEMLQQPTEDDLREILNECGSRKSMCKNCSSKRFFDAQQRRNSRLAMENEYLSIQVRKWKGLFIDAQNFINKNTYKKVKYVPKDFKTIIEACEKYPKNCTIIISSKEWQKPVKKVQRVNKKLFS